MQCTVAQHIHNEVNNISNQCCKPVFKHTATMCPFNDHQCNDRVRQFVCYSAVAASRGQCICNCEHCAHYNPSHSYWSVATTDLLVYTLQILRCASVRVIERKPILQSTINKPMYRTSTLAYQQYDNITAIRRV
jgi:hypothetical protein